MQGVIELVLKIGREVVFDVALEKARQERCDKAAAVLRDQALGIEFDIFALLQYLKYRRIGRWPADPQFLKSLDEARFGIARGWLGEVLLGLDGFAGQCRAFAERR